jgi:spore coat polysaccharide biosynthesis predicted glycosyltransferase SpsG
MMGIAIMYQLDSDSGVGHYVRSSLIAKSLHVLGIESTLISLANFKENFESSSLYVFDSLIIDVKDPQILQDFIKCEAVRTIFYVTDLDISKNLDDERSFFFIQSWSSIDSVSSRVFSGPEFLVVDPLVRIRSTDSKYFGRKQREKLQILISMGSRDTKNMNIEIMLRALGSDGAHHYHFLLNSRSSSTERLLEVGRSSSLLSCYVDVERETLLDLYSNCDVAIGGCGISLHEKLLLGLRCIAVPQSRIEEIKMEEFPESGIVKVLTLDEILAVNLDDLILEFANRDLTLDFERYQKLFGSDGAENIATEVIEQRMLRK